MTLTALFWLIVPLLVAIALIDLATASPARRAWILQQSGLSQRAIAETLGVSRYRVRLYLAN